MPAPQLPSREFLVECFDYNPDTGAFRWRTRPDAHFGSPAVAQMWNTQNAGSPAFVRVDADGYNKAEVRIDGRRFRLRAHRAAFKIAHDEEPEQVDHRDMNRTNNAIANLRAATQQQNQFNRVGWSGRDLPKGVYRDAGVIRAAIWLNGKSVKLGRFSCPVEAHEAYCRAAQEHHGEFFNAGQWSPDNLS